MAQALTKSASIPSITTLIRTHSVFDTRHEWSGGLHEGVGGDGEQAGLHVGGVQQVPGLVAAEHGQGHRGRGQEDGCRHLETVGEEIAASDWSGVWHLFPDWPVICPLNPGCELIFKCKQPMESCLGFCLLSLRNFYCVYNMITLLKVTQ